MRRPSRTTETVLLTLLVIALAAGLVVLAMRLASGSPSSPDDDARPTQGSTPGADGSPGGESPSEDPDAGGEDAEAGADVTFTLAAAGDVITYPLMNEEARQADGSYDYWPMIEPVAPYIEGADLALCNLEVPVAPEGEEPQGY
ncbi:MAG: CapA family protein, partial [Actinomycetaceae bacterium]